MLLVVSVLYSKDFEFIISQCYNSHQGDYLAHLCNNSVNYLMSYDRSCYTQSNYTFVLQYLSVIPISTSVL